MKKSVFSINSPRYGEARRLRSISRRNSVRTELVQRWRLSHMVRFEFHPPLVGIVRAAPELQVVEAGRATTRKRDNMVELQEPSFLTAAIGADEAATPALALPDGAADRGWHMPAV